MADYLSRMDFIVLDELGYLPFAQSGGQLLVPSHQQALRADLGDRHHEPGLRRMPSVFRRRQDETTALLDRLTTTATSSETGNESWRFKNRL